MRRWNSFKRSSGLSKKKKKKAISNDNISSTSSPPASAQSVHYHHHQHHYNYRNDRDFQSNHCTLSKIIIYVLIFLILYYLLFIVISSTYKRHPIRSSVIKTPDDMFIYDDTTDVAEKELKPEAQNDDQISDKMDQRAYKSRIRYFVHIIINTRMLF